MDAIPITVTARYSKPHHDYPGPKPVDSQVPDHVKTLAVDLPNAKLDSRSQQALSEFQRAANYIAAGKSCSSEQLSKPLADVLPIAMIFLKDNVLLERELSHDDIKPRLLGMIST